MGDIIQFPNSSQPNSTQPSPPPKSRLRQALVATINETIKTLRAYRNADDAYLDAVTGPRPDAAQKLSARHPHFLRKTF